MKAREKSPNRDSQGNISITTLDQSYVLFVLFKGYVLKCCGYLLKKYWGACLRLRQSISFPCLARFPASFLACLIGYKFEVHITIRESVEVLKRYLSLGSEEKRYTDKRWTYFAVVITGTFSNLDTSEFHLS